MSSTGSPVRHSHKSKSAENMPLRQKPSRVTKNCKRLMINSIGAVPPLLCLLFFVQQMDTKTQDRHAYAEKK